MRLLYKKYWFILLSFVCSISVQAQMVIPEDRYNELMSYEDSLKSAQKGLQESQHLLTLKQDSIKQMKAQIQNLQDRNRLAMLADSLENAKKQLAQYKKSYSDKELAKAEAEKASAEKVLADARITLANAYEKQKQDDAANEMDRKRYKDLFVEQYIKWYSGMSAKPLNLYSQNDLKDAISHCQEFEETVLLADSLCKLMEVKKVYDLADTVMSQLRDQEEIEKQIGLLSTTVEPAYLFELHQSEFKSKIKELQRFWYYSSNLQWFVGDMVVVNKDFAKYRAENNQEEAYKCFLKIYENYKDNLDIFSTFPCIKRSIEEYLYVMQKNACVPSEIEKRILELKFN